MTEKKIQCNSCSHNIQTSSCGSCATKGTDMVKNISQELGISDTETEDDRIAQLKYSCKIIMQYPEDYEKVNPYQCAYYLPNALKFF